MVKYYPGLNDILLGAEFVAAIVAIAYWLKVENTYWRWFVIYLCVIALQELYGNYFPSLFPFRKQDYYAYFGIPVQYLFLYWLYAYKSLKRKQLFFYCTILYLSSFIPLRILNQKIATLYSINLDIGSIILMLLVILEFLKQIKNDNILRFKENKMFYINAGVILGYIGTFPFFAFYQELLKDPYIPIWNIYYLYFLLSNIVMYLLFALSFICGKHRS